MKIKKTKKSKKQRGNTTYGHGARKKWKGKGHRGGKGMAGTGKRADQKKTKILKLYGKKYFGKQGITSKKTEKRINKIINLDDIQKKYSDKKEINLKDYKVLSRGELKRPFKITAKEFSKQAKKKIQDAGGEVIELKPKEEKKISNLPKDGENREEKISESSLMKINKKEVE